MSCVYLESSAVLRAVLDDDPRVRAALDASLGDRYASTLTFLEAHRAFARARHERRMPAAKARLASSRLDALEALCGLIPMDRDVVAAARTAFPVEPVRSLDAIHLATIRLLAERLGGVVVATLDRRIRANLDALGIPLAPGLLA